MSSYDCVLPIRHDALRAIVAPRGQAGRELPIEASALRRLAVDVDFRLFESIRASAASVEPVSSDRFYGRLQDRPRVAVAGAKNGFVIDGLERTWIPEQSLYRCRWTRPVPGAELIDALLHGCRGLPGLPVLSESPAWPAFDDPMLLGYLLPDEVRRLDACAPALGINPHARMLRAMIGRAAAADLCLVTLQSGLL